MYALVGVPGGWELVLIVLVIVLFFGAAKLPELARGSGRALRIFKAETKGLTDDDEPTSQSPEQREIEAPKDEQVKPADDPIVRDRHDGTTN